MITIIDYGSGNIKAIENIYTRLNIPCRIAVKPEEVINATKIFLPGVGAFDETISRLDEIGFREVLDHKVLNERTLIIGICVGMQILAESSEEGKLRGLGYIKGQVRKLDPSTLPSKPKLPHLGWNTVELKKHCSLLERVDPAIGFYFLHNYYFDCSNEEDVIATSTYGIEFASVVNNQNTYGIQFHPEKSHSNGVNLLHNFAKL